MVLSGNSSFTTSSNLTVTGVQVSGITSTGATITWTTSAPADSQVQYGTTTSYGSATPVSATRQTSHSVTLSGLAAGTTYQYRVRSVDAGGTVALSGNFSFATQAALTITGVQATAITASGATITWTTNQAADSQVQYGTTTSYGQSTPVTTTRQTTHSVTLTGLAQGTTYQFRTRSANTGGTVALSANFSFATTQLTQTTVAITVDTTPSGLPVQVDGVMVTTPHTFQWTPGTSHTLTALSPVGTGRSRAYFQKWSDGGPQARTISVPGNASRFTAVYTTRHKLARTVVPQGGGRLVATQLSADVDCDEGTSGVQRRRAAAERYSWDFETLSAIRLHPATKAGYLASWTTDSRAFPQSKSVYGRSPRNAITPVPECAGDRLVT